MMPLPSSSEITTSDYLFLASLGDYFYALLVLIA